MPLYEIVLRHHDRDEIRLTDRDPGDHGEFRIKGVRWTITSGGESQTPGVARRYVARVAADDPASASE
jgi:hypothetical protein